MRFSVFCVPLVSGFGSKSLLGIDEDVRGLADPASYEKAFVSPGEYTTPTNLLERKDHRRPAAFVQKTDLSAPVIAAIQEIERLENDQPSSFLQTVSTKWKNFFTPYASLDEAKSASLRLEASQEQENDKASILRSKIDVFKNELESQVETAKKERKAAEDRMARRGSFVQTMLQQDFQARELEKISEMQRNWKLAADRLAHTDMASAEPNAALIDATTKVESDKKRMLRLNKIIEEDMEKVERDSSIVAAEQAKMKKEQALRDFAA